MAYQDGDATIANQHGSKVVALPLQEIGNGYATEITRRYGPEVASYYNPLRYLTTGYLNHLLYSDDFSNAAWTKVASTGTANAATDPEGGTAATKIAEDGATSAHNVSRTLVIPSGVLNYGALLKAGERTFARLRISNATDSNLAIAVFNLSTGVVLSGSGTIKKLLNGWYWCYVTGTATVANSICWVDLTNDGATFSYAGSVGSGIYAWKLTCITGTQTTPWPAIATTATTRAVTSAPVDLDDPLAFLVYESEPDSSTLEVGMAVWTRRYANVPAPTIHYSTIALTKPNASAFGTSLGVFYSGDFGGTPTDLGPTYSYITHAFANNQVYGPLKSGTGVGGVVTGGTFTVTFGANTTAALAYNEVNGNIETAINALASVIAAGLTINTNRLWNTDATDSILTIGFTVGSTTALFTCTSSMTRGGYTVPVFNQFNSATSQSLNVGHTMPIAAHGFNASLSLFLSRTTDSKLYVPADWDIIDANTIAYNKFVARTFSATMAGQLLRAYTPGSDRIRTKITENFYLPGFTVGIADATQIPIPDPALNDAALFALVVAATSGFATYDSDNLDFWDGRAPIYRQATIDIDRATL